MVGIPLDETGPGMPEVDGGPLGSRPPRPLAAAAAAAEAARLSWSPFRGTSAPSRARDDDTGSSGRASDPWRRGYSSTAVHCPTGTSLVGATVTGLSLALNSFNFPSMQAAGRFSRLSTTTTTAAAGVSFSTELPPLPLPPSDPAGSVPLPPVFCPGGFGMDERVSPWPDEMSSFG